MKYLVCDDRGTAVFIEEFETLSEANHRAWFEYKRNQTLTKHYHIFVATPAEGDDLDIEDNYFDSKTFYLPREESSYKILYEATETIADYENLEFVVDNGNLSFIVPWNLIKDHYIEEIDSFDGDGEDIIFDFYKEAVQEKRDEILAFYELN